MVMILKRGSDKKTIESVLRKLKKRDTTKGLKASKYAGTLNLKIDGLTLQRQARDEWE